MMCNNDSIVRIHELELMIAQEIKRICDNYHIKYFLVAGTLLGAVRHGGFIPWDDDMDIGMLREDYDRFLDVCKEELGPQFYLHTWDTDPEYPFSYAKVRLKGTSLEESFAKDANMVENGVFVDIFPFDNAPDCSKEKEKQSRRYFCCKRLLWIKKGFGTDMLQGSLKQKIKYCAFWAAAHFFSYDAVKAYFRKTQIRYNNLATRSVVTDGSYSYARETIDRKWVNTLENILFEGVEFSAFQESKEYLEHMYGDFMQLPPIEKRTGHSVQAVDLGEFA